jgi:biopolymer transport protein ExbD
MAHGLQRTEAEDEDEPRLMLDINTTPLIDVLLVLLVMLIITIPVQLHAVKMALPSAPVVASSDGGGVIALEIDAQSNIFWQGQGVTAAQLEERLAQVATQAQRQKIQPQIQIRSDKAAAYGVFVQVLASTRRHGLSRVAVLGAEVFAP